MMSLSLVARLSLCCTVVIGIPLRCGALLGIVTVIGSRHSRGRGGGDGHAAPRHATPRRRRLTPETDTSRAEARAIRQGRAKEWSADMINESSLANER